MKTIEQHIEDIARMFPRAANEPDFHPRLRMAMREVTRDQRHACAEAVLQASTGWLIAKDAAHEAIMNTPEPGK